MICLTLEVPGSNPTNASFFNSFYLFCLWYDGERKGGGAVLTLA